MKEVPRTPRLETVPREQMPEVLRVAAELYAQEQAHTLQAEEFRHLVDAASEVGLPPDYLERAAAIVADRHAEEGSGRRGRKQARKGLAVLPALGLAVGLAMTGLLAVGRQEPAPMPPPSPVAASVASASVDAAPLIGPCVEVDLSPHVTQRLDEPMLPTPGNHLGNLLAGIREGGISHRIMHGVPFRLDGVVLVGPGETTNGEGASMTLAPQIEGIAIDRQVKRLHFLQGTHWRTRDGDKIGAYIVHYADGTRLEIPIRYGEDVRDWWEVADRESRVSRARVAWSGSNEASSRIRLYMRSWQNPYPEKRIRSVDMVTGEQAAGRSAVAPFLVGLTAEQAEPQGRR